MGDNAANDFLIEDESEEDYKEPNQLQDVIGELGRTSFLKYPKHTSNLRSPNITGLIQIEVLNEYMHVNFGYRYKSLDRLISEKQVRVVSRNGYGLEKIIEALKSIQASFEQTQLPTRMRDLLNR